MADGIVIALRSGQGPSDDDIKKLLQDKIQEYQNEVNGFVLELHETIDETIKEGNPKEFAFGRFLNYVRSLEVDELQRLAAGAIWMITELDG